MASTTTSPAEVEIGGPHLPANVINIGGGFYNIRGSLKMVAGLIDIGVHMSLLKLASGKFLVFDTIAIR